MYSTSTARNLKRRADDSDNEETPVKQARVSVQNTHVRRLPPLRRSDTQALDVNASEPVLQRFPPNIESAPVAAASNNQHREQEQDMGGSTDEESQDEEGAWDRRAKAHRRAALFERPREPAPRMKPRVIAQTPSEVALLEGSDSDSDMEDKKLLPTADGATTRFQRLAALRTGRAAAGKAVVGPKTRVASSVMPKPVAPAMAPPSVASSSTSTMKTTTTTKSVSRASSRTTITTTTTVAQRVEETNALSSSCPTRAPRARAPKPIPAPQAPVTRPQRQSSRARQNALNAIAGSSSTSTAAPAPVVQRLSTTASLASQPSAILRRSRRIMSKLGMSEIE